MAESPKSSSPPLPSPLSLVGRHGKHDSPKGFPYLHFGGEGKKEEKEKKEGARFGEAAAPAASVQLFRHRFFLARVL